jgi:hypothetical protein
MNKSDSNWKVAVQTFHWHVNTIRDIRFEKKIWEKGSNEMNQKKFLYSTLKE